MKIETGKDKIVISDFDEIEVIKIAMKLEQDGLQSYKKLAAQLKDEKLSKVFLRLADDEAGHLAVFYSMYESLLKSRDLTPEDVDVEESLFDYLDSGIFDGLKDIEKTASIKDVVRSAKEVEMKTIIFYSEISWQMSNPAANVEVGRIVEEEKLHYDILKNWEEACK